MAETAPGQHMIDHALRIAAQSPCRSKRGVVLYDMRTGAFRGAGFNGPPQGCPGRAVCAGTCGKRSAHAEMRALRCAEDYRLDFTLFGPYDLIHVELAADGGVVACAGPSCPGCAAQILDVGFVGGVWLYERFEEDSVAGVVTDERIGRHTPRMVERWLRYDAQQFYMATLERCGMKP